MKTRRDNGKASLVDFLRSIKFDDAGNTAAKTGKAARFAHFRPRFRTSAQPNIEDAQLIRSAN